MMAPTNEVMCLRVRVVLIKLLLKTMPVDGLFRSCRIEAQTGALFPHEPITDCSTCTK